jgi:fumarate hydratase subunit beta
MKKITAPLNEKAIADLKAGDRVLINGTLIVARDAAHKRGLNVELKDQVLFYAGPTPGRGGKLVGSIGPTTSSRMDPFTIPLLEKGLKGMIGKGGRSREIRDAIRKHKAVYFVATGGAAALLGKTVKHAEVIAYPELGPEAVLKLEVLDFPAVVAYDIYGGDVFEKRSRE